MNTDLSYKTVFDKATVKIIPFIKHWPECCALLSCVPKLEGADCNSATRMSVPRLSLGNTLGQLFELHSPFSFCSKHYFCLKKQFANCDYSDLGTWQIFKEGWSEPVTSRKEITDCFQWQSFSIIISIDNLYLQILLVYCLLLEVEI